MYSSQTLHDKCNTGLRRTKRWNNLNANRERDTRDYSRPSALLGKLHDTRVSPAWELRGGGGGGSGGGGGGGGCRGALSLTRRAHAAFLPCSLGAASRSPARNRP